MHVNFLQDRRFLRCKNGFMREDGHREEAPGPDGPRSRNALRDDARFFTSGCMTGEERVDCLTATFRKHRYALHAHETFVIGAITSGCGTLWLQGTRHRASPGDLTLLNPEDVHDGTPHDDRGYSYRVTYHSGMRVQIFRNAGPKSPPTYFAVVVNPNVKNPSGAVLHAKSYAELKQVAEARAERKAFLLQRKKGGN